MRYSLSSPKDRPTSCEPQHFDPLGGRVPSGEPEREMRTLARSRSGTIRAVLVALVGVFGALLGVLVTRAWEVTSERQRWVRDERAEAYATYVDLFQELRQIVRRLAVSHPGSEEWQTWSQARRSLWGRYNAALVRVELLGSPAVYSAALRVDVALRSVNAKAMAGPNSLERWHQDRLLVDSHMRDYIDRVRSDLGLKELESRGEWVLSEHTKSFRGTPDEPPEIDVA